MKLAIMQPYFFPYVGYFQLIQSVDRFILLDDVQYIRHGWINRNRILKPHIGNQYIIAPLKKHHQKTEIKEIEVVEGTAWKERIIRQLEHYKRIAPNYEIVKAFLEDCFLKEKTNISSLNASYLKKACDYIGITTPIAVSSELKLDYERVTDSDEWALQISEQVGADEYINPAGGMALFDKRKFKEKGIKLTFLKTELQPYNQFRQTFESNLSILDVMMFNSKAEINQLLHQRKII